MNLYAYHIYRTGLQLLTQVYLNIHKSVTSLLTNYNSTCVKLNIAAAGLHNAQAGHRIIVRRRWRGRELIRRWGLGFAMGLGKPNRRNQPNARK